jgi:hypothetical protein|tara:strand:- start:795 stop:977 length:183 start_codon:yes stop_codon:yes gene_type:complete
MKMKTYELEESLEYLLGKEEGFNLALMIVGRRHIEGTSVRWLVNERDKIRKQINELMEEE